MADSQRTDLAPLFLRLAVLWVAAGALFKLFAGTPNDLPPVMRALPLSLDLTFKLAIAIELAITFAALLRPRLAWPAVVALFAVFEGVLLKVQLDGAASCGCFGSSITIPPGVMMAIDGVLLLLVLVSRPWRSEAKPWAPLSAVALTTVVSVALPFAYIGEQKLKSQEPTVTETGEAVPAAASLRYVELRPLQWEGQMIYDVEELQALLGDALANIAPDLTTCIFYRGNCEHCELHLRDLAEHDDGSRFYVLMRVPDDGATEDSALVRTMPIGPHVTMLTLPEGPQYVLETPADFQVEGGLVVAPREGIEVDEH